MLNLILGVEAITRYGESYRDLEAHDTVKFNELYLSRPNN